MTPDTYFPKYLLAVDKYSRMPFLVGLKKIDDESIIQAFKYIMATYFSTSGKLAPTTLSPITRIQADYGSTFTSKEFQQLCVESSFKLTLASPKHLEMNSVVECTCQSLCLLKIPL